MAGLRQDSTEKHILLANEQKKNTMENPIDFVITWVDGQDKSWRRQRDSYSHTEGEDDSEVRYRDWGILRYWFRGVEQFAPWVRTIHFVTWGIQDDMETLVQTIKKQRSKIICINDAPVTRDSGSIRAELQEAFEKILPNSSSFERNLD